VKFIEVSALPRYMLIVSNETYVALIQEAARQGKSFGKLVNEILVDYVKKLGVAGGTPRPAVCICCGRQATIQARGYGQQTFFLCPLHRGVARKMRSFREL